MRKYVDIPLLYRVNISLWYNSIFFELPEQNLRDAEYDNAGDDIDEIIDSQDTHQLVEVVPLWAEPDDEGNVTKHANNTNHHLQIVTLKLLKFNIKYK